MTANFDLGVSNYGSKNIIVTEDGKKYQKAGFGQTAGAVIAANIAGGAVIKAASVAGNIPLSKAMKEMANIDVDTFKKAADMAFEKSGLAEKGVKFIDATAENKALIDEVIGKALPKWMDKVPFIKNMMMRKLDIAKDMTFNGKNAFYLPNAQAIVINKDKMSWAAFHEMGHALNKNTAGLGNVLQKIRGPFGALAGIALLTALFKRKKVEGEKPKNAIDKVTTFIKDNCGKLAFVSMVPLLMEEGLASMKGLKLANGLLSAENLKTVKSLNIKAWLTYAAMAVGVGAATALVSKVRDTIAAPKEIK